MSPLSGEDIRNRLQQGELRIEQLDRDLVTPIGVDLRVDSTYQNTTDREEQEADRVIELDPDKHYNLQTVERVELPENMYGETKIIMKNAIDGLAVQTGVVYPGYSGPLILSAKNLNDTERKIEVGSRIVSLLLFDLQNEVNAEDSSTNYYERL